MPRVIVVDRGDVIVRRPAHEHRVPSKSSSPVRYLRRQVSRRGLNQAFVTCSDGAAGIEQRRPVIRRVSLAFMKEKLWLKHLDQDTHSGGHPDRIFEIHERNVQSELRRRKTEGDLKKRAEFNEDEKIINRQRKEFKEKISRPIQERPTVPNIDTDLRERHQDRQERWEARDGYLDVQFKRRKERRRSPIGGRERKSRLSMNQLRRLSVSILQHEWPGKPGRPIGGKKFTKPMPEAQAKQMLHAAAAEPESVTDRVLKSFEDQRWSYGPRSDVSEPLHPVRPPPPTPTPNISPRLKHVRIAEPSPAQLSHSVSTSQLDAMSRQPLQAPRKYSSVRQLRSDHGPDPNRARYRLDNSRPPRHQRYRSAGSTDQSHIHPALRTTALGGAETTVPRDARDQRHIHPALRVKASETTEEREVDDVPREYVKYNPKLDAGLETPDLQITRRYARVSPTSSPNRRTLAPSPSAGGIPNHPVIRSIPVPQAEQHIFHNGLNEIRAEAKVGRLRLDGQLSLRAQDWADLELAPLPPPKEAQSRPSRLYYQTRSVATRVVPAPDKLATRLVSGPCMPPMSCVEGWRSGRYRRHKTVEPEAIVGEHRYSKLPVFESDSGKHESRSDSGKPAQGRCTGLLGPCLCLEHDAWKVVVDQRWTAVGIGKAVDGRWVVEFVAGLSSGNI